MPTNNKGLKELWGYPLIDEKARNAISDTRSSLENDFQKKTDDTLGTVDKTVPGAINEIKNNIDTIGDNFTSEQSDTKYDMKYNGKSIGSISMELTEDKIIGEGGSFNIDLTPYQTKTDTSLNTTDKTIKGAINEINTQCKDITKRINYITPEIFGAKGDGISDDTKAIQNCINIGGNVYLAKKYKTKSIEINKSTNLFGGGFLIRDTSINDDLTFITINASNVHIYDITIDNVINKNIYDGSGMKYIGSNTVIDNCTFKCGNFTFRGNYITVSNCTFKKAGLTFYSANNVLATNNNIECMEGCNGITAISDAGDSSNVICSYNTITEYSRMGIEYYTHVNDSKIIGNYIKTRSNKVEYFGISIHECSNIDVVANKLENLTTDNSSGIGIEVVIGSNNIICNHNTIINYKKSIRGDTQNIIIENNILRPKSVGIDLIKTDNISDTCKVLICKNLIVMNTEILDDSNTCSAISANRFDYVTINENNITLNAISDFKTSEWGLIGVSINGSNSTHNIISNNIVKISYGDDIKQLNSNLCMCVKGYYLKNTMIEKNIFIGNNKNISAIGTYGGKTPGTLKIINNKIKNMSNGLNFISNENDAEDFITVYNNEYDNVTTQEIFNRNPAVRRFNTNKNICYGKNQMNKTIWENGDIVLNDNFSLDPDILGWICVDKTANTWKKIGIN